MKKMVTDKDASIQLFGTPDKTSALAQMRYRNTGPKFYKIGRKVRYCQDELDDYLNANAYVGTGLRATDAPEPATQ